MLVCREIKREIVETPYYLVGSSSVGAVSPGLDAEVPYGDVAFEWNRPGLPDLESYRLEVMFRPPGQRDILVFVSEQIPVGIESAQVSIEDLDIDRTKCFGWHVVAFDSNNQILGLFAASGFCIPK